MHYVRASKAYIQNLNMKSSVQGEPPWFRSEGLVVS